MLIHGRSQEHKDSRALKAEWLDTLEAGLAKGGLKLPIAERDVRFPFYGDTLFEMVDGKTAEHAADVIVRGQPKDTDEERFTRAVLEEIRRKAGITDAQIAAVANPQAVKRGPLNWEWMQAILRAIDRYTPHGSGASIALFTHDVYHYLKNAATRREIETGIGKAITPGIETIIVGHSLGSIAAYNLLQREGLERGWKVPLFVTVGSPLAITEIRNTLRTLGPMRCPPCVSAWFNAMDERDVVALYPLDPTHFPLDPAIPAIENKTDVRNRTRNRHGIAGYLDNEVVARRIYHALTA